MKPVMEDTKNTIGQAGYYRGKDIGSEKFRKMFDEDLAKGVGKTSDRAEIDKPVDFLKNIQEKVKSLQESLSEDEDKETVKKRANRLLEQEGIDKIDEVITSLTEFKKSVKKKASPQQKPRRILPKRKTSKKRIKRHKVKRKDTGQYGTARHRGQDKTRH